jgi:hypothetical protein
VTGHLDAAPRPLVPADAEPVRALVLRALGASPYADRTLAVLTAAEHGDPESRALVIDRDGAVTALALFGPTSGASGAWELTMLVVAAGASTLDVGRSMVRGVIDAIRASGGRFVIAELPADPVIGSTLTLLRKTGFRQEARIPDFFRKGVALLFLRHPL